MVASLDGTAIDVQITYILICSHIPKEYSGKIVLVQLGMTITRMFGTHPRAKKLEVFLIWFDTPPTFKWSDARTGMDTPVMKVCRAANQYSAASPAP
jgi:hypothetical protein